MKTLPVALAATLMLTLAACGTTQDGSPAPATTLTSVSRSIESPTVTTSAPPTTSSATGSGTSTATTGSTGRSTTGGTAGTDPVAAELVGRLLAGAAATSSLTGTISVDGGGLSGDEPLATFGQLTDGAEVTALQMEVTVPGAEGPTSLPILLVEDRFFIGGVIAEQYDGTWVEITADTTDPTLSELYTSLADSINSASVTQYVTFLTLARDTTDEGPDQVDGVDARRYALTLDLTALDEVDIDDSVRASLEAVVAQGITEVPCLYWIDGEGRLLRAEQTLAVGSENITTVAAFTDFDAPLEIAVPDASLIVVAP
ncbi:hypothetical protein [Nakamurella deserti]|uniref:hypothetical protein n=1 Tax=Nakamurella deserti TaxID=2164074 RepID=UPI0013009A3E|nr:hypothetical protein [Nakamurella deserti]